MPLMLVTGPANSAKAAVVLDGVRAALERDPLLVVPTAGDVERYRRELADGGAVFGPRVVRFAGLIAEAARRAAIGGGAPRGGGGGGGGGPPGPPGRGRAPPAPPRPPRRPAGP